MKDQPNNNFTTSDDLPYLPIVGGLVSSNIKTFIDRDSRREINQGN